MPDAFYTDKLYPFMDRVLSLLRAAESSLIYSTVAAIHCPQPKISGNN